MRGRAWRRYKNYTKAKRKREIDLDVSWYPSFWLGYSDGEYAFPKRGILLIINQNMECMIISISIVKIKFIVVVLCVQQRLVIKDIVEKEKIMLQQLIIDAWI